ncbi:MAG TPA: hypothetical protein VEQ85_02410 [Lacipirellulaceae bacterium]|nr:hypothetical protein [Lacipirellulaceae bacterium]
MATLRAAKRTAVALATLSLAAGGGCASIISGRHADVAINSDPPQAHVTVRNARGQTVAEATTPAVVSLRRGDGFLRRASYTATIEKPGYLPAQAPISSSVNPWIAGNLVFGGIPGLIVDPYTGAMWQPSPREIHQNLYPAGPPQVAAAAYQGDPRSGSLAAPAINPAVAVQ